MPIYSDAATELFKKWQVAYEQEHETVKALAALCAARAPLDEILSATERMEEAHAKTMDLYDRLQAYRLDE